MIQVLDNYFNYFWEFMVLNYLATGLGAKLMDGWGMPAAEAPSTDASCNGSFQKSCQKCVVSPLLREASSCSSCFVGGAAAKWAFMASGWTQTA